MFKLPGDYILDVDIKAICPIHLYEYNKKDVSYVLADAVLIIEHLNGDGEGIGNLGSYIEKCKVINDNIDGDNMELLLKVSMYMDTYIQPVITEVGVSDGKSGITLYVDKFSVRGE